LLLFAALFTSLSSAGAATSAEFGVRSAEGAVDSPVAYFVSRALAPDVLDNAQAAHYYAPKGEQALAPVDDPVPAPPEVSTGRFRYFPETAHFIRGIFLTYWETHGATAILGLPLTEALMEDGLAVQYLERARLEWHPDISTDPRRQVLLTRLGAVTTEARGITFPMQPEGGNTPNSHFFTETGHNLGNAFLTFWQRNGGLAVFGYPLSEEVVETNEADGRQYTVQYFERNRFEWHPERSGSNNVQLGLLGTEFARMEGLNPLSRILLPAYFAGSEEDVSDSSELDVLVEDELLPAVQMLGRTPQFRWVPGLIVKNNISVRFEEIADEDVAGAFIVSGSRNNRRYAIIVPETERDEPVEALASVLAHEATHGFDVVTGALPVTVDCSIEAETRAFMNGLAAWVLLKGDDTLSQRYEPGSLSSGINSSLRRFNGNSTTLEFGFDPQAGRDYLRTLYGADCGR
jgi:hypothetical protein